MAPGKTRCCCMLPWLSSLNHSACSLVTCTLHDKNSLLVCVCVGGVGRGCYLVLE